jgi:hypothetical protein
VDIVKATQKYEAWLGERIPLLPADLHKKHALMCSTPFSFMRATFYRWAQMWPVVCPHSAIAYEVLGVGDLHVENFGTWRDKEGRLIWGINDFDEAERLPYTCDLIRLATSAHLAIAGGHLTLITPQRSCEAILDGYRAGLHAGGRPFVLAEHHPHLRQMAVERLKQPESFWIKLKVLKTFGHRIPSSAAKALRRALPSQDLEHRVVHRIAGLGSLGRLRFVALADWQGGTVAREAKELAPSAWRWANPRRGKTAIHYQEILDRSIRCEDPFVEIRGRWVVRRLAPDCSRIELTALPSNHDALRLLRCMGFETANVHLGSAKAAMLERDLESRGDGWLHTAANEMLKSITEDWEAWRKLKRASARLT